MISRLVLFGSLLATSVASADDLPTETPLAQIRDGKELSEVLTQITQDPAVQVDDPQKRTLAQRLMVEGVRCVMSKG